MMVNINKTKIVHFGAKSKDRNSYEIMYGTDKLDIVDKIEVHMNLCMV